MQSLKTWLRNPSAAGRRHRSLGGLLASLLIAPLLLGVMACFVLPVPIGDPEKSRIDPALSGIWLAGNRDGAWLVVLEPYDRRSWLVTWIMLEVDDSKEGEPDPEAETGELDESPLDRLRRGYYVVDGISLHKGWLTEIKGTRFLVWQPLVAMDSASGMQPEHWWVQRVESVDDDFLDTDFIDPDFEDLKNVESRRQAERLIRRHIANPALFIAEGELPDYRRVPQEAYDLVAGILEQSRVVSSVEDL